MSRHGVLGARRGDWPQVFFILFFALLLIIAIVLLTVNKPEPSTRPGLRADLHNQYANAYLLGLLRTQAATQELPGETNIADLIILAQDGKHDEALARSIDAVLEPGVMLDVRVRYPDGKEAIITNVESFGASTTERDEIIGRSIQILPGRGGDITVTIEVFTEEFVLQHTREIGFKTKKLELKRP